jgi:murein DD-endopeptidase MepM/ murein hydrolase activator NlpD
MLVSPRERAAIDQQWRLPFCLVDSPPAPTQAKPSRIHRSVLRCLLPPSTGPRDGELVQGVDGAHTHVDELRYAYDFALPLGTPVLAARRGVVVATCDVFTAGGLRPDLRAHANHLAIRHEDGLYSRYFHLAFGSILVGEGETVEAGQPVAASGNTGFSSGPHLHFDLVDALPTETSVVQVQLKQSSGDSRSPPADSPPADDAVASPPPPASTFPFTPASIAAAFCPRLPPAAHPVCGRLVLGCPPTASSELDTACAGAVVLLHRCDQVDFIDKVRCFLDLCSRG